MANHFCVAPTDVSTAQGLQDDFTGGATLYANQIVGLTELEKLVFAESDFGRKGQHDHAFKLGGKR
ncbi:MAG: hypothetical protein HOP19_26820 [Acidobacteria bacterium]|nr:hypothetical protein [Acidobacteriota bacterium]